MNISEILSGLRIQAEIIRHEQVDHITKIYLKLAYSCSIKDVQKQATDMGLFFKAKTTPIISPVMEEGLVLIQFAHDNPIVRKFSEVWKPEFAVGKVLPVLLGMSDAKPLVVDFADHPHTLIAGGTGSGKSVLLHSIINSTIATNIAKVYLIDPKLVEFAPYKKRVGGVFSTYQQVINFLTKVNEEMNRRYVYLAGKGHRSFNGVGGMYPIFIIADEIADLMLQDKTKELEGLITGIAQKSRASGIFLTLATQRPSVNVLTGVIKANFPARIALRTSSKIDSQVILDEVGAENLMGRGDGLFRGNGDLVRFQGVYCEPC